MCKCSSLHRLYDIIALVSRSQAKVQAVQLSRQKKKPHNPVCVCSTTPKLLQRG